MRIRVHVFIFVCIVFSFELKAQSFNTNSPHCICVPAFIVTQPVSPSTVCPNAVITFSVVPGGTGPYIYKWKENGVFLSDGGVYSGTQTASLTITHPTQDLDGKVYQCLVSNCNRISILSDPDNILIIETVATDLNGDGITDNQDFSQLNLLYNSTCVNCREDINSDGFIDVKDFLQLLGAFNTACQ